MYEPLHLEVETTMSGLERHAEVWDLLAEQCNQGMPSYSFSWIASHFEYLLSSDETWLCLFAYNKEELVGVLPVIISYKRIITKSFTRLCVVIVSHNIHL